MCIGGAVTGVNGALFAEEERQRAQSASQLKQKIARAQVMADLQQQAEAKGQKQFSIARESLAARGEVANSQLGGRSVAAIRRAVNFKLGQNETTLERNQEITNLAANAALRGIDITRQAEKLQIGDASGKLMAFEIVGSIAGAAGGGNQSKSADANTKDDPGADSKKVFDPSGVESFEPEMDSSFDNQNDSTTFDFERIA